VQRAWHQLLEEEEGEEAEEVVRSVVVRDWAPVKMEEVE
jgi:hypothetical protein